MKVCNCLKIISICMYLVSEIATASRLNIISVNEQAICNIKITCLECLRLSHCSWCPTERKCFSEQLQQSKNYCEKEKIRYPNYEMSSEDNAVCACAGGKLENSCRPPDGPPTTPECSGRGSCICGRCFCDANPDSTHPSKAIMGEYCEYDNFSCDDPKCNEGPYSIYEMLAIEQARYAEIEKQ